MAYNLSQYNKTSYNLGQSNQIIVDKISMDSSIIGLFTASQIVSDSISMGNVFNSTANAMLGIVDSIKISTIFNQSAIVIGEVSDTILLSDKFLSTIWISAIVKDIDTIYAEKFTQKIYVSAIITDKDFLSENTINENLYLSAIITDDNITYSEIFLGIIDIVAYSRLITTLDAEIPAGGKLVIDSDNYNVLLDNNNAIWTHGGAWIDELSRNTLQIYIICDSVTNLDASILYTERYL